MNKEEAFRGGLCRPKCPTIFHKVTSMAFQLNEVSGDRPDPQVDKTFIPQKYEKLSMGVCVFQCKESLITCVSADSQFIDLIGATQDALVGHTLDDFLFFINPEDGIEFRKQVIQLLDCNDGNVCTSFLRVFNRKKGRYLRIQSVNFHVTGPEGRPHVSCNFVDLDSQPRFGSVINAIPHHAPGGIFVYSADDDERFSYVSPNMLSMLGYTQEEFDQKFNGRFSCLVYPEDRERVLAEIESQIKGGRYDACTYRIEKKDGTVIWVRDEGHIVVDENGHSWFYVVILDITSSVQAHKKLTLRYNKLRQLIDVIPVSIAMYRKDDKGVHFVSVNGHLNAKLQMSREQMLAMNEDEMLGIIYPEDRPSVRSFFYKIFLEGGDNNGLTFRALTATANTFQWCHCDAVRLHEDDGKEIVYAVYTDASYRNIQIADFSKRIQDILTANPLSLCTFRLNLSRNLCSDCHGTTDYISQLLNAKTADQLLDSIASVFVYPDKAKEFLAHYNRQRLIERFRTGKNHFSITYRRLISGDEAHWVTTYFHLLENPHSRDVEAIAYSVDSDNVRKEEEILAAITSEEYEAIGLIDVRTNRLSYFYHTGEKIQQGELGPQSYSDSIQQLCKHLFSDDERKSFKNALSIRMLQKALLENAVYSYAYFSQGTRGEQRRKQISFRYLEKDHLEILFLRSDITTIFNREEQYMAKLHKALLEAEKANDMKSDFIGNVSHDIRTPLNAILGYNKLAMAADSSVSKNDYLHKIDIAGNILLTLVNDTLDLQKIENGSITLKPEQINYRTLLEDVISSVEPLMKQRRINFIVDIEKIAQITVSVDSLRVRQVFINLLSNAIKFTPEGGRVELLVDQVEVKDNRVLSRVLIRDTGIGMSQSFQNRMFEPFSQERTQQTSQIEGSGLGLSIVRRLLNLMNGKIDVSSEPGKGTSVTLHLDFQLADGQSTLPSQHKEAANIKGVHILLCEDNPMNTEIAKRLLEMQGAEVTAVSDGQKGLELFLASPSSTFDIILMDIRMPNMNGYMACRKIRESSHMQARAIPILAMSADAYASDVARALESGMNGHVAKPLDPAKLFSEVSRLVATNR